MDSVLQILSVCFLLFNGGCSVKQPATVSARSHANVAGSPTVHHSAKAFAESDRLVDFEVQKGTSYDFDVDIVYTYVDPIDPVLQDQFNSRLLQSLPNMTWKSRMAKDAITPERFRDWGELKYSLRSISMYAKWVRKIFLVISSGSQVPKWIATNEKVAIVRHQDLIPNENLPTFNSFAIECYLHQITGLSEHFLYLNDDMFFGAPVYKSTFFTSQGRPKVNFQYTWRKMDSTNPKDDPMQKDNWGTAKHGPYVYNTALWNSYKLLDQKFNIQEPRWPVLLQAYPLTKQILKDGAISYAPAYNTTASHFFSTYDDIWPIGLALWHGVYESQAFRAEPDSDLAPSNVVINIQDDMPYTINRMKSVLHSSGRYKAIKLINLGDQMKLKLTTEQMKKLETVVQSWMDKMFPSIASWEKKYLDQQY